VQLLHPLHPLRPLRPLPWLQRFRKIGKPIFREEKYKPIKIGILIKISKTERRLQKIVHYE